MEETQEKLSKIINDSLSVSEFTEDEIDQHGVTTLLYKKEHIEELVEAMSDTGIKMANLLIAIIGNGGEGEMVLVNEISRIRKYISEHGKTFNRYRNMDYQKMKVFTRDGTVEIVHTLFCPCCKTEATVECLHCNQEWYCSEECWVKDILHPTCCIKNKRL
jgi:hypothetical protein